MNLTGFQKWFKELSELKHLIIAGPCAAESEKQVLETAMEISKIKHVKVFRAGVWKPRTSPSDFQGIGNEALKWLSDAKKNTGLLTCVEVATPEHIEQCLKNNVDIFWIGARTVANPFSVQAIADALKGIDVPVLVKNPINPDLKLWIGAIERVYNAGINKIAAIHRGFYPFEETKFRNIPKWEIPIELKTIFPDLQIINDPSHIAGKRELLLKAAEQALCMDIDGFMIETHINPQQALSDANQQITPAELTEMLDKLIFREKDFNSDDFKCQLENLRLQIDSIDFQLIELLSKRMKIVEKIGNYKNDNNISILQLERWRQIRQTRIKAGEELNLDPEFVKKLMQIIHNHSISIQTKN